MILKGSQRGGATQLGLHLMRLDENDHVQVHEVRGFLSADPLGAFREAEAVSRATKCRQFLFSVSLSPPSSEDVPVAVFERAVNSLEERLGLTGQPRVLVFHEKSGRRHAHCVWSRIDADELKAINLPYFKRKLVEHSRELYLEHGWRMPRGLAISEERSPLNYSRAEYEQAKRIGRDPQLIKQALQDCWATSDSGRAFESALEARGYFLARGDRRAAVLVDWQGEVYSATRWIGVRQKDLNARLGSALDGLPEIASVNAKIATKIISNLSSYAQEATATHAADRERLNAERLRLRSFHRDEREQQEQQHRLRSALEARARASRMPRGIRAVWYWITGRYQATRTLNEANLEICRERDSAETQALVQRQLKERRQLQHEIDVVRRSEAQELRELDVQMASYVRLGRSPAVSQRVRRGRSRGPVLSE